MKLVFGKYTFIKLDRNLFGVDIFELKNHAKIDGVTDYTRLNIYLTKDGSYVTIWQGFFESLFVASKLEGIDIPKDFDFDATYTTNYFRGYIETKEQGEIILDSLRLDNIRPQVLSGGSDNKLGCYLLDEQSTK